MTSSTKNVDVILSGVVGSTAYGLATEGKSDIDIGGVYMATLPEVLGLHGRSATDNTKDGHEPGDYWYHELTKFMRLAMKGNPTVLEILYLKDYKIITPEGAALIARRPKFLAQPAIRGAYGGYAKQQADRLVRRNAEGKEGFDSSVKYRTEKHGRHCLRLIRMGAQLLSEGTMDIDCTQWRDELFEAGRLAGRDPLAFYQLFERELDKFNNIDSHLPDHPAEDELNDLLISLRLRGLF